MIQPPFLNQGDTVIIVAPARKLTESELRPAIKLFNDHGLKVESGKYLFGSDNQFSGTDLERAKDLQDALNHPHAKAVICARGGYGTSRIIDRIDFSIFKKHPKWVVGFSDITVLHSHIHAVGVQSIHASMPVLFEKKETEKDAESLMTIILGKKTPITSPVYPLNQFGQSNGQLIGGNLSVLCHLIGTPSDIDTAGKILFIEDLDEYLYHIDRMMLQLKRAGKLDHLSGLIVGGMTDMNDNKIPFGKTAYEIIHHYTQEYDYPAGFDFPVGHASPNHALICGADVTLTVGMQGSTLTYN